MLCQLGHNPSHTLSPPPPSTSSDNAHSSQPIPNVREEDLVDPLTSNYTDFSVFLAADKLMQLSGKSKGESSSHKAQKLSAMNGIVKQSKLIKKENPTSNDALNSDTSLLEHVNGTTLQTARESNRIVGSNRDRIRGEAESDSSKMEVDNHVDALVEERKDSSESSKDRVNGVEEKELNVKEENREGGVSDGVLSTEEEMEVGGDKESESGIEEEGERHSQRYEPGFGKTR